MALTNDFKVKNGLTVTDSISAGSCIEADSFEKHGGTSSQFLKADGSVDSTAYGTVACICTTAAGLDNAVSFGTVDLSLDLNELSTSTTDGDGDFFVVVDSSGNQKKLTKGNINNSGFNNDAGFATGTVTCVLGCTGITVTNGTGNACVSVNAAQPDITSLGTLTSLTVDDITLNGSTISDSGDFTLDIGGDITIDAGGGNVYIKDDGTTIGQFFNSSSDFVIKSEVNNKDLVFKGKDNGADITALTLDMSDAGTATFNHNVNLPDGGQLNIGANADLYLTHDDNNGYFYNNKGDLFIDQTASDSDIVFKGTDGGSDITALRLDMSDGGTAIFNNHVNTSLVYGTTDLNLGYAGGTSGIFIKGSTALAGNVGIGTTHPTTKLQVVGDSLVTGNSTIYGNLSVTGDFTCLETTVSTTSALSVTNTGTGPALYVCQAGVQPVAHFIDANGGDVVIADDGKVGIGTFTPSSPLHISSDENVVARFHSTDANATLYLSDNGTSNFSTFKRTSDNLAILENGGNVGIGTSSPAAKLDVVGGHIRLDAGQSLQWDNTHERIEQSDGHLEFFVNNGEAMTLDTNGLGIGTTSPSQKLHVKGIGMIEDASSTSFGTLQFGTDTSRYLRGNSAEIQFGSTIQQLHFQKTNAPAQVASSAADGVTAIQLLARNVHTSANLLEVVNGNGQTADFVIDSSGNVGIGDTTPSYKLDVAGDINSQSDILSGGVDLADIFATGASAGTITGVTAGDGLIGGGTTGSVTLNVSAGDGVQVTANCVSADSTVVRTSGAQTIAGVKNFSGNICVGDEIRHGGDFNTRLIFGTDTMQIEAGDCSQICLTTGGTVINEEGKSIDFRVEGDTDTHALFVDGSTDRVGIGTTNPAKKLHVLNSTNEAQIRLGQSGSGSYDLGVYANDTFSIGRDADTQEFNIEGGNVGIGTASPKGKLHVLDGTAGSYTPNSEADTVVIESSEAGGISLIGTGSASVRKQKIVFGTTGDTTGAVVMHDPNNAFMAVGTTTASNYLKFLTGDSTEAMRLDVNGNVGIGTTAPSQALTVSGNISANEAVIGAQFVKSGGTSSQFLKADGSVDSTSYGTGSVTNVAGCDGITVNNGTGSACVCVDSTVVRTTGAQDIAGEKTFTDDICVANKIIHDGDSNTFIQLANDIAVISTGGEEHIRANNSGVVINENGESNDFRVESDTDTYALFVDGSADKVGIGTANPSKKLHVAGDGLFTSGLTVQGDLTVTGDFTCLDTTISVTSALSVQNAGTGPALIVNQTGSNDIVDFRDDGTSAFYIEDGGNVGIGTTNPTVKFEISDANNPNLRLQNTSSNAGNSGTLEFREADTNYGAFIKYDGDANFLRIGTRDSATDYNRISINRGNGRVGIGCTTPTQMLDVNGSIITNTGNSISNGGKIIMQSDGTLDWGASANYGTLTWDTGYAIMTGQSGNGLKFLTNNNGLALILDTSQNATFAGQVQTGTDLIVGGGDITLVGTGRIQGIDTVSSGTDAANKTYADTKLACAGGTMTGNIILNDNVELRLGTSSDFKGFHNGTTTCLKNYTGHLILANEAADSDIRFCSDNGSGGLTEYFELDGSVADGSNVLTRFPDQSILGFGSGNGFQDGMQIYHNGCHSYINNYVGDLEIVNSTDDGDIIFKSDNGSGSVTEYLTLDGGLGYTRSSQHLQMADGKALYLGNANDMGVYHNSTDSFLENSTGHICIVNHANDKDIVFKSDDGSGGTQIYMMLDGSEARLSTKVNNRFDDNARLELGTSGDLDLYHNGTDSIITNATGDLYIQNSADDKDIYFQSDNGSGGMATYIQVDGSAGCTVAYCNFRFNDCVCANFGTSNDLKIYHDGSNSYIADTSGTGSLIVNTDAFLLKSANNGEFMMTAYQDGAVNLMHNNSTRLSTTNCGISVCGNALVSGHVCATTKSFVVDNPTTGGQLRYSVVEGNEHGVTVRGSTCSGTIELPDEWDWLVEEDSVTAQLTPVGGPHQPYIVSQDNKQVVVCSDGCYNYNIYGTRKDVEPLEVNIL